LQILWADPISQKDYLEVRQFRSKNGNDDDYYLPNTKRSTGYFFSERATDAFLMQNKLTHVIRAHEVIKPGYKHDHRGKVVTIFSSSHYLGGDNEAAAIMVETHEPEGFIKIIKLDT